MLSPPQSGYSCEITYSISPATVAPLLRFHLAISPRSQLSRKDQPPQCTHRLVKSEFRICSEQAAFAQ
jgi:hypothetical protein